MAEPLLELESVTKTFNGLRVLNGIDCHVRSGEIYSLLGPNGAGKTTTVRIILGTLSPDQGRVRIFGLDSAAERPRALGRVGFMLEKACLNVELTLDENLRIYSRIYGLDERRRRLDAMIELTGLSPWRSTTLSRYSKGMLQKAALCRALIHDPRVLILDEPSSGMDPVHQEELRGILIRLREEGKAVLLCSHDLLEVERMSTHVGVLSHGRIARSGTVNEVKASCRRAKYRLRWGSTAEALAAKQALAEFSIVRSDSVEDAAFTVLVPNTLGTEDLLKLIEQRFVSPAETRRLDVTLADAFFCEVLSEHGRQGSRPE